MSNWYDWPLLGLAALGCVAIGWVGSWWLARIDRRDRERERNGR